MKRDLDLVRDILFWIEAAEHGRNNGDWDIRIDGHTDEEIGYHIYLMQQAGLVIADDVTTNASLSPCWQAYALTRAGHDFISATRDAALWRKTRALVADRAIEVSFSTVMAVLQALALRNLGIG